MNNMVVDGGMYRRKKSRIPAAIALSIYLAFLLIIGALVQ